MKTKGELGKPTPEVRTGAAQPGPSELLSKVGWRDRFHSRVNPDETPRSDTTGALLDLLRLMPIGEADAYYSEKYKAESLRSSADRLREDAVGEEDLVKKVVMLRGSVRLYIDSKNVKRTTPKSQEEGEESNKITHSRLVEAMTALHDALRKMVDFVEPTFEERQKMLEMLNSKSAEAAIEYFSYKLKKGRRRWDRYASCVVGFGMAVAATAVEAIRYPELATGLGILAGVLATGAGHQWYKVKIQIKKVRALGLLLATDHGIVEPELREKEVAQANEVRAGENRDLFGQDSCDFC